MLKTSSRKLSEEMEKPKADIKKALEWVEQNYNLLKSDQVDIKNDNKDMIKKEMEEIKNGLNKAVLAMGAIQVLCGGVDIVKE